MVFILHLELILMHFGTQITRKSILKFSKNRKIKRLRGRIVQTVFDQRGKPAFKVEMQRTPLYSSA